MEQYPLKQWLISPFTFANLMDISSKEYKHDINEV